MIAVIDYGAGNVFNVLKACRFLEVEAKLTSNPQEILRAQGVILPGVGAFQTAMENLRAKGLIPVIQEVAKRRIPLLGVCLGMQMLFDSSAEFGQSDGLHLIPGRVVRFPKSDLLVPQVGWNQNHSRQPDSIFNFVDQQFTYFVHSYYARCERQYVTASVDYGVEVPAIVQRDRVYGMQFHPEKSGQVGLRLLKAFFEEAQRDDLSRN